MSLPFEIDQRRQEIRAHVESEGAELLEILFRGGGRAVITLIVDTPAGVTLDECAQISRRVGAWLDDLSAAYGTEGAGFLRGSYLLEVQSPGLDRPLRTERDFTRLTGKTVRVTWKDPAGRVVTRAGEIVSAGPETVSLRDPANGEGFDVAFSVIVRAAREIRFGK